MSEKRPIIIAISGKIGSGKSKTANIICNILTSPSREMLNGYRHHRIFSFGDKVKAMAAGSAGFSKDSFRNCKNMLLPEALQPDDDQPPFAKHKAGWTFRDMLQKYADAIMKVHPRAFIYPTLAEIEKFLNYTDAVAIIDDLRTKDELMELKNLCHKRDYTLKTIRLERFCYDSPEDYLVTHSEKHISKLGTTLVQNYTSAHIVKEVARLYGYQNKDEMHWTEKDLDSYTFDRTIINNFSDIYVLQENIYDALMRLFEIFKNEPEQ